MINTFIFLGGLVSVLSQGNMFRFDYEFDNIANGWLKYHVLPATWQEARMRCQAEGATLASPLSVPLRTAITSYVKNKRGPSPTTFFTGVHATFAKGVYTTIEGVPLSRLAITWAPGEPDNFDNAESCLAMYTDGTVLDVQCDKVLTYVCYKKETRLSRNLCGTTDPGYTLDARTGSCYKFHSRSKGKGLYWSQAYMTCAGEGGYLLVINSELEAKVIKDLYDNHPNNQGFLIGFHDWGQRSHFMTIHGETFEAVGYEQWAKNQPDNATNSRVGDKGQFCGSTSKNLLYNDVWCHVALPFICEKSPSSLL